MWDLLVNLARVPIKTTLGAMAGWAFIAWMVLCKPWVSTLATFTKGGVKAIVGDFLGF